MSSIEKKCEKLIEIYKISHFPSNNFQMLLEVNLIYMTYGMQYFPHCHEKISQVDYLDQVAFWGDKH